MRMRPAIHLGSFGLVLLALWYAAASQSNSVAYLLFFVALALALTSIPHGAANLRGIEVAPLPGIHGYAGSPFPVPIRLLNKKGSACWAVEISWRGYRPERLTVVESGAAMDLQLGAEPLPRGTYELQTIRLRSSFPFGLVTFYRDLSVEGRVDIYPVPRGTRELPVAKDIKESTATGRKRHGDDFAGLRAYQVGDSQRHVDWRAVARGQSLLVKQFEGAIGGLVLLDLETTPGPDLESRLSQLALWVIEAEAQDVEYGLELGDYSLPASKGSVHQHACLRELARYPGHLEA